MRKRFDELKEDGVDLTKLDKSEFENLFGEYDEEVFGKLRYESDYEREKAENPEEESESSDPEQYDDRGNDYKKRK